MKKLVFNNCKPLIIYYTSISAYLVLGFFFSWVIGFNGQVSVALAIYVITSIVFGYFTDLKKYWFGLVLLETQLIFCPYLFKITDNNIFGFGNMFDEWSLFQNKTVDYVFSITFPLLLFLLGFAISKFTSKLKHK